LFNATYFYPRKYTVLNNVLVSCHHASAWWHFLWWHH